MALLPPALADVVDRADRGLAGGGYDSVSVRTADVRRALDAAKWAYIHPERPAPPIGDVEHTAQRLVAAAKWRSSLLAVAAGFAGVWSVPPEIAAATVATLRLAQRLAITFGFDPETDRGRMILFRALADALDVELPERGPEGVRVSDLPALAMPNVRPDNIALWLARAMVVKSMWSVAGRITRFVPVVASGLGAWSARNRTQLLGSKMIRVYRRAAEMPLLAAPEDAQEIRR